MIDFAKFGSSSFLSGYSCLDIFAILDIFLEAVKMAATVPCCDVRNERVPLHAAAHAGSVSILKMPSGTAEDTPVTPDI